MKSSSPYHNPSSPPPPASGSPSALGKREMRVRGLANPKSSPPPPTREHGAAEYTHLPGPQANYPWRHGGPAIYPYPAAGISPWPHEGPAIYPDPRAGISPWPHGGPPTYPFQPAGMSPPPSFQPITPAPSYPQNPILDQSMVMSAPWMQHRIQHPTGHQTILTMINTIQQTGAVHIKGGAAFDVYQACVMGVQNRPPLHDVDIGIGVSSVYDIPPLLHHLRLAHCIDTDPHFRKSSSPDVALYRFSMLYAQDKFIGCSFTLPAATPGGLDLDISIMQHNTDGIDYVHSDLQVLLPPNTHATIITPHSHSLDDVIKAREKCELIKTKDEVVDAHWRFIKWVGRGWTFQRPVLDDAIKSFTEKYATLSQAYNQRRYIDETTRKWHMSKEEIRGQLQILANLCVTTNLPIPEWVINLNTEIYPRDPIVPYLLKATNADEIFPPSLSPLSLADTAPVSPGTPPPISTQSVDQVAQEDSLSKTVQLLIEIDQGIHDIKSKLERTEQHIASQLTQPLIANDRLTSEQKAIRTSINDDLLEDARCLNLLNQQKDELLGVWTSGGAPETTTTAFSELLNTIKTANIGDIKPYQIKLNLLKTADTLAAHTKSIDTLRSSLTTALSLSHTLNKNQTTLKKTSDTKIICLSQEIKTCNTKLAAIVTSIQGKSNDEISQNVTEIETMIRRIATLHTEITHLITRLSTSIQDSNRERERKTPPPPPATRTAPPLPEPPPGSVSREPSPELVSRESSPGSVSRESSPRSVSRESSPDLVSQDELLTTLALVKTALDEIDVSNSGPKIKQELKKLTTRHSKLANEIQTNTDDPNTIQSFMERLMRLNTDVQAIMGRIEQSQHAETQPIESVVDPRNARQKRTIPHSVGMVGLSFDQVKEIVEEAEPADHLIPPAEWALLGMPPLHTNLKSLLNEYITSKAKSNRPEVNAAINKIQTARSLSLFNFAMINKDLIENPSNDDIEQALIQILATYQFLFCLDTLLKNDKPFETYFKDILCKGLSHHILLNQDVLQLPGVLTKLQGIIYNFGILEFKSPIVDILLNTFKIERSFLLKKMGPVSIIQSKHLLFTNPQAYKQWIAKAYTKWVDNEYPCVAVDFCYWDEVWTTCMLDIHQKAEKDSNEKEKAKLKEFIIQSLEYLSKDNRNTGDLQPFHWDFLVQTGNLRSTIQQLMLESQKGPIISDVKTNQSFIALLEAESLKHHNEFLTQLDRFDPLDRSVNPFTYDRWQSFFNIPPMNQETQERLKIILNNPTKSRVAEGVAEGIKTDSLFLFSVTMLQVIYCLPEKMKDSVMRKLNDDKILDVTIFLKEILAKEALSETNRTLLLDYLKSILPSLLDSLVAPPPSTEQLKDTPELDLQDLLLKLSDDEKKSLFSEEEKSSYSEKLKQTARTLMGLPIKEISEHEISEKNVIKIVAFYYIHQYLFKDSLLTVDEHSHLINQLKVKIKNLITKSIMVQSNPQQCGSLPRYIHATLRLHDTCKGLLPPGDVVWNEEEKQAILDNLPIPIAKQLQTILFKDDASCRTWATTKIIKARQTKSEGVH